MTRKNLWFIAGVFLIIVGVVMFFTSKNPEDIVKSADETDGHQNMASDNSEIFLKHYSDNQRGFSMDYPSDYSLNVNYQYEGLGPDKSISGVKATIATSTAEGTNLSSFDTGVSIEEMANVKNCDANLFLYPDKRVMTATTTDGGAVYSVASTTGVGLGNYYEETVFAIPDADPCVAIRYLIHFTNIQNYPPGTVREFDRAALLSDFDKIRRSFVLEKR